MRTSFFLAAFCLISLSAFSIYTKFDLNRDIIYSLSTTIIIVIKNNVFTIGVDGMEGVYKPFKNKEGVFVDSLVNGSVCKITKNGGYFCTGAGFCPDLGLSLSRSFLNKSDDFDLIKNDLKDFLSKEFEILIEHKRIKDKLEYEQFLKKPYFASLYFCCFQNGIATVYEFDIGFDPQNKILINIQVLKDRTGHGTSITAGETDAIKSLNNSGSFWNNNTILDNITELLRIEIKDKPLMVGDPISIIEIRSKNDYTWFYSGKCNF